MFKTAVAAVKKIRLYQILTIFFLLISVTASAQAEGGGQQADYIQRNMPYIIIGLLAFVLLLFVFGLIVLGDKLIKITAQSIYDERGEDAEEISEKFHLAPRIVPARTKTVAKKVIELKRGFNIYIKGRAEKKINHSFRANTHAVRPIDFVGISPIPKLTVEVGSEVKAGDPLFFDKKRPEIMYCSPVSGELVEVKRGPKRAITEVVVLADKEVKFKEHGPADPNTMDRQAIVDRMLQGGVWPYIRQRPYSIVADPNDDPKMIYISCFDTAPLAPDYDFIVDGKQAEFQAGVDVLRKLTENQVHLGLDGRKRHSSVFTETEGVVRHWFAGPHPAGNVGVQVHHVNPINKGEVVWYLNPQDVIIIGRFFLEGRYNTEKLVAVSGPEIREPQYFKTYAGAAIEGMIKENLLNDHVRYISGNVLTGKKIELTGHIGFHENLLTVIMEGDYYEFMGFIMPSTPRPTFSPTILSYFFQGEEHVVDTNTHGEERAFVVTGLYEELLPMDIYPMQLCKAILAEDFERIEGLGIYEISEEDVALCEFACPSKTNMQAIIGEGLELMRTQG